MKPRVSWVIPVFRAEKYLRRALDSVLNQSMQEFEVIIVMEPDDSDNTEQICREYEKRDSRIKVIKNDKRLGIAKSLNVGLKESVGDYVARMDADDYSYPDRLKRQVEYMDNHLDVGVLCTNRRVVCDNGTSYNSNHPTDSEEISARLLFGFCLNHPSMMLRMDLFRKNGWKYPEGREAEDYGLCAELIKYTKIECLDEVLIDYHEHGDNAIYSKFDTVRKASAWISKNAIRERLGIEDIDKYDDIYFGWRELDYPLTGIEEYLKGAYELFGEIYYANKKRKIISEEVFCKEITRQWQISIDTSGLGFLMPDANFVELLERGSLENEIESSMNKLYDVFFEKRKVAVWGTGGHCKKLLGDFNGEYPFNLSFFVDGNKKSSVSESFLDRPVYSPEILNEYPDIYIVIASYWYKDEILTTLTEQMGFNKDHIFILPNTEQLLTLKEKYMEYGTNDKRQVYLFMSPDYGNMGDHAIAEAEKDFLSDMGACVYEFPADDFGKFAYITQCTRKSQDLIAITGGGFLGSLWYEHEKKVEQIIALHPNNDIVVFPQTLYWDEDVDKEKIEKSISVFNSHSSLTLCARDFVSYMNMKKYYPKCNVLLLPDMTLYKDWSEYKITKERSEKALICLKQDKESVLSSTQKEYIKNVVQKYCYGFEEYDTDLGVPVGIGDRKKYLLEVFERFKGSKLVITDRLHGMMFAAITETPCIALDNCNHKMRMTYEWLSNLPYIKFARNLESLEEDVVNVLNSETGFEFCRDEFFSDLKRTVKQILERKNYEK